MDASVVSTLVTLSEALGVLVLESASQSGVAARAVQAVARGLGCQTVEVWLPAEKVAHSAGGDTGSSRAWWQRLPLVSARMRPSAPSRTAERTQRLCRIGVSGPEVDGEQLSLTLEELSGGAVVTLGELAHRGGGVLRLAPAHDEDGLRLLAGLFHRQECAGLLACAWQGSESVPRRRPEELLLLAVANYLAPVFGGMEGEETFQVELYLAGIGLLLTALDVGPAAVRECAEAVTRVALERAASSEVRPSELQSLQWAALFHEVGRLPMEHWLTFPVTERVGNSNGQAPQEPSALSVIPGLAPAARLLDRAIAALKEEDGGGETNLRLAEQILFDTLRIHCRQTQPIPELEEDATLSTPSQGVPETEEPWDTLTSVANEAGVSVPSAM